MMNIELLTSIIAALAVFHFGHAVGEMWNVRFKVRKLNAVIDETPLQEKRFKINSTAKIIAAVTMLFVLLFGGAFLIFSWLQLTPTTLVVITIALIDMLEVITQQATISTIKKSVQQPAN